MSNEKQRYLEEELAAFELKNSMTGPERRALRKWVRSGHSVYESPGSRYCLNSALPVQDFLDVYRQDHEIDRELKGKTRAEQTEWLKAYMGYDEPEEQKEPGIPEMKEHIRKLEHELFNLWEYISQEGLGSEAQKYVDEKADEPIPFEFT